MAATFTPSVSAASGFSPTARILRPRLVRLRMKPRLCAILQHRPPRLDLDPGACVESGGPLTRLCQDAILIHGEGLPASDDDPAVDDDGVDGLARGGAHDGGAGARWGGEGGLGQSERRKS